jgi:transcriptional regulator with PAS, ATPase and Fis domain
MKTEQVIALQLDSIPETILNSLPSGIIFCDKEGRIRFINRTYADYLGVDQGEVIGRQITEYIPGSRIHHVIETGKPELGFKCSVGEGKEKKILIVNRIPVKGEDDSVLGVISQSLFGDIGELKDLSERLDLLEKKVFSYREKIKSFLSPKYSLCDIRGNSPGIITAKELVENYAKTEAPVLLLGATGTGKELFAHALHLESRRYRGPFVGINCAAIPQELFESELFGYEPGAFSGAQREGKMGQIELAGKGTLFLDEIGDMPVQTQVKLLRVLEEKIVYRLGSNIPKEVNFRLVAATNRDLREMIQQCKFREELYYRLNTMTVQIPPLRERKEDIAVLVRHFLNRLERYDVSVSSGAMNVLMSYAWPGNVRELKNAVERAASLCKGATIDISDLPPELVKESSPDTASGETSYSPSLPTLSGSERQLILAALRDNKWNMAKTARVLGISRATLYEKKKKFQIARP